MDEVTRVIRRIEKELYDRPLTKGEEEIYRYLIRRYIEEFDKFVVRELGGLNDEPMETL